MGSFYRKQELRGEIQLHGTFDKSLKFSHTDVCGKGHSGKRRILGPSFEEYQHFKTLEEAKQATETEKSQEKAPGKSVAFTQTQG